MSFFVVIPARYASTRLPGKPLLEIQGQPMIRHVADACEQSAAEAVIIATDYQPIADIFANSKRSTAMLTRADHVSGTDRVAEVARRKGWSADTVVVNVQGDEPQMPPPLIDQVAALLHNDPRAEIATLSTTIDSLQEFLDPSVVKVVTTDDGAAMYFTRAPIPWKRESATSLTTQREFPRARRHVGIYAYRVGALIKMTGLPQSSLERIESLEQLRALQAGMRIVVGEAVIRPGAGVDTPADLDLVRATQAHRT